MYHLRPIVALLCAEVGVFARLLFADQDGVPYRLIPWDFRSAVAPWLIYGWDVIKAGFLPLWCPYVAAGTPFFANPQTQLYSPLSLLLGAVSGYSYRVAQFHSVALMFIGGVGAYFLAHQIWRTRSAGVIAGLCFELSSTLYGHLEHGPILSAYALAPWFFWGILLVVGQRSVWGVPLLAGVVYWILSSSYLGVVFMLFLWGAAFAVALACKQSETAAARLRLLLRAGLAVALGAGVAAVAWLPFAASFSEFTRGEALSLDYVFDPARSLPPKQLWGAIFPFLVTHPLPGVAIDFSMRGIYFGAAAVVLAAVGLAWIRGWMVGALSVLAIGSVLMALGTHFFMRIAIHIVAPIFNFSRFPAGDSHYLAVLALSVLAGGGALLLADRFRPALRTARAGFLVLIAIYVLAFFLLPLVYTKAIDSVLSAVTFEALCMALALLIISRFRDQRATWLFAGLLLLETGTAAIMNFEPAGAAISGVDYKRLADAHAGTFGPKGTETPRAGDPNNAADQSSGAGYVAKTFFVSDYNPVRLKRLDALLAAGFLPWLKDGPRVIALPPGPPPVDFATFKTRTITIPFKIEEFTPNYVRYQLVLGRDVTAVFNEIYFPGWTATVDGVSVAVDTVATGLRSLPVTTGTHVIEFRFRPTVFIVALVISAISLAILIALVVLVARRSRRFGAAAWLPAAVGPESALFFAPRTEES